MKKQSFAKLTSAAILLFVLVGTGINLGIFYGRFNLYQLRYFTTLSNLLVGGCALWALLRGRRGYAPVKGLALLCILLTCAVYHTLLTGSFGGFVALSPDWWADLLRHTVVPVLTLLDWLLFDEKGRLNWGTPLWWVLAPIGYFAATVAIAMTGWCFPWTGTPYPYPFMDVWSLGWGPVLRNVLLLAVGFFILGCVLTALDRLLGRKAGIAR